MNKVLLVCVFVVAFLLASIAVVDAATQSGITLSDQTVHMGINFQIKRKLRGQLNAIVTAINNESQERGFDPVLIMSIIQVESGFRIKQRGRHGEIGLMQIKPSTGRWVAKKFGIPWYGKKTLENPLDNIRIGTAYLSTLKAKFLHQEHLFLSAYNMGSSRLIKAIKSNVIPNTYATKVKRQYQAFQQTTFSS
jgi:soluble lytic murein transglycosylase